MILIDAGPLVALVDADDQNHRKCVEALDEIREPLTTVLPVLAEALYRFSDLPRGQEAIWEMILRGAVGIVLLDVHDVPRIRELMREYRPCAIDLADAALLHAGERAGVRIFFTVDPKGLSVYRLPGRLRAIILPSPRHR